MVIEHISFKNYSVFFYHLMMITVNYLPNKGRREHYINFIYINYIYI